MNGMEQEDSQRATILQFPRRRGRPKSIKRGNDSGTPELAMKRLLGETAEALDLCLERGIITREQHWCGIHLRWLYTLRHGAPGVRAIDPTHLGGIEVKVDDPEWRQQREKEFHEAIRQLTGCKHIPLLMNVCIHNERPKFLNLRQKITQKRMDETANVISGLREGLDILVTLWGKTTKEK